MTEQKLTFAAPRLEEMRHMLGLMFVVFPILTYLPVFFMYWLGKEYVHSAFGLLAALLYLFVPAVGLNVAHLDFAVFPLLVIASTALFVVGSTRRRLGYVAASAVAFMLYFVMTLGATGLLAFFVPFVALLALGRIRAGESVRRVAGEIGWMGAVYALVCGGSLAVLYATLNIEFVDRYAYARELQRNWVTSEYNWFWVKANLLGWFLAFGLALSAIVAAQQGRSLARLLTKAMDAIDCVTLAWLCLVIGLVMFGRQHGETNRLWTFLSPLACLIAGRLIYDMTPSRRYLPVLVLLFGGLVLARYRLSYF